MASDISGVSGRLVLDALNAGQRDPSELVDLAKRQLRSKIPALTEALTGRFTEHHAFLDRLHLNVIDQHSRAVEELAARIEVVIEPLRGARDLMTSIPGNGLYPVDLSDLHVRHRRPGEASVGEHVRAGAKVFNGGEGVWFDSDHVYFTTKGDNRVWDLDIATQYLSVLYDAAVVGPDAPLTGVDNLVVSRSGDIFVGEDGGNLEVVMISTEGQVAPVVRLVGHDLSEVTGPAFSPDGLRLYFSSQRGTDGRGVTFEVTGPFRTRRRRRR